MNKYLIIILLTMPCARYSGAQALQTIYYANGNKAIEGRWQYNVNNVLPTTYERADIRNSYHPFGDVMPIAGDKEIYRDNDWYLITMKCQGKIITWYPDGVKKSEITFVEGVPSGPYARYHPNGKLALEGNLVAGMPQGPWKTFYSNGQPYFTGQFQPYSQQELHHRWQNQAIGGDYTSPLFTREPQWEDEEYIDSAEMEDSWYSGGERVGFATYNVRKAFRNFSIRAISKKDGVFIFYHEDGTKQAELAFRNNKRNGTWKLWDGKLQPSLVLEYDMGGLRYIIDSNGRKTPAAYTAWWHAEMARRNKDGGVVEEPAPPQIFRYVEQMPAFNGDVNAYVQKEMKLTKRMKRKSFGHNASIEFSVLEDGQVSNAIITEHANPGFDRELLRVVNGMPRWKPGKMQGRAVKTHFRLSFSYGLRVTFSSPK